MEPVLAGFAILAGIGLVASTITHVRFRARVVAVARLPVSDLSDVTDSWQRLVETDDPGLFWPAPRQVREAR